MTQTSRPRRPLARRRLPLAAAAAVAAGLAGASPAAALNYVTSANGNVWGIHDAAAPGLDTGSIRDVSRVVAGSTANTSNALFGFGGLRVQVSGIPDTDPTKRLNGELLRGWGLEFNGTDAFSTTTPVVLGGVAVDRTVRLLGARNAVRYVDAFTNTRDEPVTVDVVLGGTAGLNTDGNRAVVSATGDGDTAIEGDDAWVGLKVPSATDPAASVRGPSAVVLGTPAPFPGALAGTGVFQRDPFTTPLPTSGLEANFYGFKRQLTLAPGETKTLMQYVVTGFRETAGGVPGEQVTTVNTAASALAGAPDFSGMTRRDKCTLANWDRATIPAVDAAACASLTAQERQVPVLGLPKTSSPYDVFDKSITELAADMASGKTTSQQITRAYLDRIAAYDTGPFGFHSFISVADDAMAQAKAADARRAAGDETDLLGIPVAVKDLYDTKDLPTTDGTRALRGWRPKTDAFQVARMRAAGAVILGKTNLSEFANSGSYSESGYMMTWNAIKPSKTPLGSSGGSGTAAALSLAGFAMGTQTGVSLYAPSTGAGLVTMRGTDGISSGAGVMPLTYLQDFEGPMARTVSDVARVLNVTTGTDPDDPATVAADADAKRPADWKAALDPDALRGKRIGFPESAFTNATSYGQDDGTIQAMRDRLAALEAAGATVVPMTGTLQGTAPNPSTAPRSRTEEGWQAYWDRHPEGPYRTASDILSAPENLPYNRGTTAPAPRLTPQDVQGIIDARTESKRRWATWLDANQVDAVAYPGFRSDVYDNDGAQVLSSDRGTGVTTSNYGVPTIVVPVGANPHGDPMSLQLVGRAFDDAKVLGYGYALEQALQGQGRVVSGQAPPLAYDPAAEPVVPEPPVAPAPETVAPIPAKPDNGGPAIAPPAKVAVSVLSIGRLTGRTARVTVRNAGTATVKGTLALKGRIGRRTTTLGTARVSVAPGRSKVVTVRLTGAARRALRGRKRVRLTVRYELATPVEDVGRGTVPVTVRR